MWQKLHELKNQFWLALLFFVLTLAQQYLFYAWKGITIVPFSAGKYLGIFVFFFICTLIKGRKTKYFFLSLIMLLNFPQMVHLSYFGTQLLPAEFWLFFAELSEVRASLFEDYYHVGMPLLFTLVPVALGYWLTRKRASSLEIGFMKWLLILYLIYNPARTFVTGNSWGRQPSTRELSGFNVYLSASYFLGKILPYKLIATGNSAHNSSTALAIKDERPSNWDKIIFILGESASPHNMQLFGYERETTPYLHSLKNEASFAYTTALSGGVSTDIAVAFFLNLGFGGAGSVKAAKGHHCLIKLAAKQNFLPHFWSTQSMQQLRYITPYLCGDAVKDFRALEDLDPTITDENAASDLKLLDHLPEVLAREGKDFIMLHQRGSHSPWTLRYSPESNKFKPSAGDDRRHHYDNSIVELDRFWKALNELIIKNQKKVLVIYLSDHGEATGQDGQWGHGFLGRTSFEVPLMIQAFGASLPEGTKSLPRYLPHYNVALYLSRELGISFDQSAHDLPKDYEIYGNDIDGFSGSARIHYQSPESYQFTIKPPQ